MTQGQEATLEAVIPARREGLPASGEKTGRFPWVEHLAVLLGATAFFFLQGPRFVWHLRDHVYEPGDSFINTWILSWDAHALLRKGLSVWNAPIFYPVHHALAFSEAMFGNLWLTAPIQYLTGNNILASNALLLASFVLGLYGVYLLTKALTGDAQAGVVAGMLFSFNPYRWGHAGHLQLQPFFWAPLALLLAHRFIKERQSAAFWGMLVLTWIQYYASVYLGTMLLTLLAAFFAVHLLLELDARKRREYLRDPRLLGMLASGAIVSALVLLPLGLPYILIARKWHFFRGLGGNAAYSAEPFGFLLPFGFARYGWLESLLGRWVRGGEGAVFLGATPWVLAMQAWNANGFQGEDAMTVRRFSWAAACMAVLMLGPFLILFNHNTRIPLPYCLVYYLLPGASAMRVPARFFQPFLLCMAVLSGFGFLELRERWSKWPGMVRAASVLGALCLFSLDYAVPPNDGILAETTDRMPPIYAYLARGGADQPVLEIPAADQPTFWPAYKSLHYQTAYWRPMLGSMSGWLTPGREALSNRAADCPSIACLKFLQITPAATIVVHLDLVPPEQQLQWRRADLSPFGFRSMGAVGNALVWERIAPLPASSAKLQVTRAQVKQKGFFRKGLALALRPAQQGKPWRSLDAGWSWVKVTLESREGASSSFTRDFEVPPYALPGEDVSVALKPLWTWMRDVSRIRVSGPLVEDFSCDAS